MPLSEREALRINVESRSLEKAGRIEEAFVLYESGVARGTDTPATYTRPEGDYFDSFGVGGSCLTVPVT